jgi:DNA polymerase III delta prime subunit
MVEQPEPIPTESPVEPHVEPSTGPQPPTGEVNADQKTDGDVQPEEKQKEEKKVIQKGGVNLNVGEIKSDKFFSADHQEFNETNIRQYLVSTHDVADLRSFSPDFTTQISPEAELEVVETHIGDPDLLQDLYQTLCEKHLLVLTGEPEMGKTTTALYLSHQLRQVFDHFNGSYLVRPLDRNVKINFHEIMERRDEYSSRMLLFKDAFSGGNRDVLEFFTQMGKPMLGSITEKLQRNHLFLVFTADTETVKASQRQLLSLNVERCIPPLKEELLLSGLNRKLRQVAATQGWPEDEIEEEIERRIPCERRAEVVQSLRTMPRISYLVEYYFLKLGEGLDLKEAIGRVDSLRDWFLNDLTDNFDAWCFALTLCLCHCTTKSPVVPWFDFEFFRESISTYLRRKLRISWADQPKQAVQDIVSENLLLGRCRADIYKDPATGVDAVKFINDQYHEMLWEILLKSNRKILTLLVPHLKELARLRAPRRRALAAAMLGRIGEIDPTEVTFSLMNEWIYSDSVTQMATVGYLYQGIWASRNNRYREDCLKRLSSLALEEDKPEVWTAIAAYKQLGVYDLPLAMKRFKEITERKFAKTMENAKRVERILRRIEEALKDQSYDENDTMGLAHVHDLLREIAQRVFSKDSAILLAIQYAIVVLCFTGNPILVFDELREWALADRESLGALVALIFLEYNGIAMALESKSVEMQITASDGTVRAYFCNQMVLAIASSEDSVRRTARFLETVYDSFTSFFPRQSCSYFKQSFIFHLKNWIDNALPVEQLHAGMVQLFDKLLNSSNQSLHELLTGLLNYDSDFIYEESKYYLFKRDVRRRRLSLDTVSFTLD